MIRSFAHKGLELFFYTGNTKGIQAKHARKLGMILEQLNENTAALEVYKRIKYEFMNSIEARDVNKYIGRLEQK
jgi:plasmid maintenance system killer protein